MSDLEESSEVFTLPQILITKQSTAGDPKTGL
jgi:hypothetical protein